MLLALVVAKIFTFQIPSMACNSANRHLEKCLDGNKGALSCQSCTKEYKQRDIECADLKEFINYGNVSTSCYKIQDKFCNVNKTLEFNCLDPCHKRAAQVELMDYIPMFNTSLINTSWNGENYIKCINPSSCKTANVRFKDCILKNMSNNTLISNTTCSACQSELKGFRECQGDRYPYDEAYAMLCMQTDKGFCFENNDKFQCNSCQKSIALKLNESNYIHYTTNYLNMTSYYTWDQDKIEKCSVPDIPFTETVLTISSSHTMHIDSLFVLLLINL